MKDWAISQLRYWMRHHPIWSSVVLIAFLIDMWGGLSWTVNLVRFGLPPPASQNCGGMLYSELEQTTRADAGLQSLACFWQAYQICQAATISQTGAGTDAGYTDTVTIERRWNRCAIYGHEDTWANTNRSTTTFLCTLLTREGDTLQVSACDGIAPFALAPLDLPQDSFPCGIVGSPAPFFCRTTQKIEACFFAAYQHCLADSMGYRTVIDGVQVQRNFYIEHHCGLAYQRGSYAATCARLELRADGLHFLQCGTDGDLFVPSAQQ